MSTTTYVAAVCVEGRGSTDTAQFAESVQALTAVCRAARRLARRIGEDAQVGPVEVVADGSRWTALVVQPETVHEALVVEAVEQATWTDGVLATGVRFVRLPADDA